MSQIQEFFKNINNEKCYGCMACAQVCPKDCIQMVADEEGFFIPSYDSEKCINCGLCLEKCQILQSYDGHKNGGVYAAYSLDKGVLKTSSSGGVFTELARRVIDDGGVVVGAAYVNDSVRHISIEDREDIDILRRSKYVQSNTEGIYKIVEQLLRDGRKVLFVGTPCQIAALKLVLNKNYENLVCVDIVCHGCPSPSLFDQHLKYLSSKNKVNKYEFRLKKNLFQQYYNCHIEYQNGKIVDRMCFEDVYFKLYLDGKINRGICYKCKYSNERREGDITIGDYGWARNYHDELKELFFSGLNISLVIANTEKGIKLLNTIADKLCLVESKLEYALTRNICLKQPANRPEHRDTIYREISELGYDEWVKEYVKSRDYNNYKRLKCSYIISDLRRCCIYCIRKLKRGTKHV